VFKALDLLRAQGHAADEVGRIVPGPGPGTVTLV
jgi:hypothetical protein